ncbi:MAG: glycerophosphodiester phosphodiesterase family protein [Capnocytophaga sp.]|nr:glycerophosphodiester phosphodiesterase family protein [Capnocytophaga sp.]
MKNIYTLITLLSVTFIHGQTTQIIAHRGNWTQPATSENSLESLRNALELNIYGSEFDVQLTADDVLVIHHDAKINGKRISKYTYGQLKNETLPNGEKLPLLDDFIRLGKQYPQHKLIIELKPQQSDAKETVMVQKALAIVHAHDMMPQSEFISFSLHICKEIKRLSATSQVQYLNGDLSPEQVKHIGLDGIDYHYSLYRKNKNWIPQAKKLGLVTNAWTVNNEKDLKWLQKMGLDFVTTNFPKSFKEANLQ